MVRAKKALLADENDVVPTIEIEPVFEPPTTGVSDSETSDPIIISADCQEI